jgi:hypothetical protein
MPFRRNRVGAIQVIFDASHIRQIGAAMGKCFPWATFEIINGAGYDIRRVVTGADHVDKHNATRASLLKVSPNGDRKW